jgi:6-pyruvoyltetrahydropterin/6-carboxytetrahydropterin synthase
MGKHLLAVKHNIEVAHRLHLLPGKCENINGHSMWVTMFVKGELDENGILEGISFTDLKKSFRHHLDTVYDHHLLLHENDPWSYPISDRGEEGTYLPGLKVFPGDPTTENIAKWIANWARQDGIPVHSVDVWETSVNMSRYEV